MDEEKFKELYDTYSNLSEEVKILQEQNEHISNDLRALRQNIAVIETFSKEKDLDEVLFPLFNGVYVKARVLDTENFISLSSKNIAVDDSKEGVVEKLKENISGLSSTKSKIDGLIIKKTNQMMDIEKALKDFERSMS